MKELAQAVDEIKKLSAAIEPLVAELAKLKSNLDILAPVLDKAQAAAVSGAVILPDPASLPPPTQEQHQAGGKPENKTGSKH